MILLDFVADRDLSLPREGFSDPGALAEAPGGGAARGHGGRVPAEHAGGESLDDHSPSASSACPRSTSSTSTTACWHRTCDNLSRVSKRSLDAVGETVYELLRSF